jgi:hypothetical protein
MGERRKRTHLTMRGTGAGPAPSERRRTRGRGRRWRGSPIRPRPRAPGSRPRTNRTAMPTWRGCSRLPGPSVVAVVCGRWSSLLRSVGAVACSLMLFFLFSLSLTLDCHAASVSCVLGTARGGLAEIKRTVGRARTETARERSRLCADSNNLQLNPTQILFPLVFLTLC